MNVFQLIKSVLDEIYVRIPGEQDEKDSKIRKQLASLRAAYAELQKGVTNDYSDPTTRFAYIHKYVTSHANIVYQLLKNCPELTRLFDNEQVNITCVGGGPGSDFLGILKYIIRSDKAPHLRCNLFDKEESWAECWNDVDEKLKSALRISTFFVPFDVTDPNSWSTYQKFLKSDLFTMVYFVSEITTLREKAESFFANLFQNAKPGALLLFVDNNNEMFYGWIDQLTSQHGLKTIKSGETVVGMEDLSEEKRDLGEYYEKFEDPKLTANVAFRIYQKQ